MRSSFLLGVVLVCSAAAGAADKLPPLSPEYDARNWASVGRTPGETHYSPLNEINRGTVNRLKLAWTLDLPVTGVQATPLAVDGVIYVAAGYTAVSAVDARTGKVLWNFDSGAAKLAGRKLRSGAGIHGLAYANGRLFAGTQDGRLIALDSKKGTLLWSTQTLDAADATFISGAPRVFNGKVAIGFGDSGATHGRINVFDANTGAKVWSWETGAGGGAIWNAITFDPDANRLYVGTGNSRGDAVNRFACSIVALNADSGEFVWQYDAAPGDHQSCDDSTDITLATLTFDGQPRNVILHAPKDGAVHVLDRASGKVISAKKTGEGGHHHFAQAFDPQTGLFYVPTVGLPQSNAEGDAPANSARSVLVAWDPVKQRAVWQQSTAGAFGGGVLSTGDLVFEGQADGYITGYSAADGRRVWAFYSATAALGAPISFAIGKHQYLAILNGPTNGAAGSLGAASAKFGWDSRSHPRRLLAFTLDGTGSLPPTPAPTFAKPVDGTDLVVDGALAKEGAQTFQKCQWCHGAGAIAGGGAPDLRASAVPLDAASFATIVRGGLEARGMPKYDELSDRDLDALRNYVRARARLVTRPDGVAPPIPEAPTPQAPIEKEKEPQKPPGSLESEPAPHKL